MARLVELNGAREALAFDDVLLTPGYSTVLPARSRHPDAADPVDLAQRPDPLRRDGHGHRGAARHRHGAGRRHGRHPPQPHARPAGRAGAAGEEVRVRHGGEPGDHPSRRDARRCARPDEGAQHLRHPGGRGRRRAGTAGRHPHQPRRPLRLRPVAEGGGADDQGPPGDGAGSRGRPRGGQAPPPPAPDREAARGRRGQPLRRPDHRQGHREEPAQPERHQGRAGPAPRRRGLERRRRRLCARRAADRRRGRPRRHRHRARPFGAGAVAGPAGEDALQPRPGDRRQRRHRRRRAGADRRRRRRGQDRHRAGLDLHDADRRRRRRAAAHRDHGRGRGGEPRSTCR